jgi:hypothetical protein
MEGLLVRVERPGDNATHLFQVPGNVEMGLLSRMVSRTLSWDRGSQPLNYQIEAKQLGRMVQAGETLNRAGILDNCLLVFHGGDVGSISPGPESRTVDLKTSAIIPPITSPPPQPEVQASTVKPEEPAKVEAKAPPVAEPAILPADSKSTPVSGWRTLDVDLPPTAPAFSEHRGEAEPDSGFVWKKLD